MKQIYAAEETLEDLKANMAALLHTNTELIVINNRLRRVTEAAKALVYGEKRGWYELQAALAALEDT